MAALLRTAVCRFNASRREAIVFARGVRRATGWGWCGAEVVRCREMSGAVIAWPGLDVVSSFFGRRHFPPGGTLAS
jgi:hypothetical protein